MKRLTASIALGSLIFGFGALTLRRVCSASLPDPGTVLVADVVYEKTGKLFILSIGINDYVHGPKLKYGVADATSLAESLERRGKGSFTEIHKTILPDQLASKRNVEEALDSMARELRPNDTFIFYFGGVGGVSTIETGEKTESGSVERKQDFYLWPVDVDQKIISATGISGKQLRSYFRRIRSRSQLLILDTNESSFGFESLAGGAFEQDKSTAQLLSVNSLFIGTDTPELEDAQLGHGLITAAILEGLGGAGDYDKNGILTAREIEAYLYSRLRELSKKYGSTDVHPRTITRGGDFALGYTDDKLAELAKQREQPSGGRRGGTDKDPVPTDNDPNATRTSERVNAADKEQSEPRKGTDRALLIATDEYQAPDGWRKLANPIKDAEAIKQRLISTYGFNEKNVRLERNLTKQEIVDVIKEYLGQKFDNPKEDQLFVFFAGHGTVDKDTGDGYLVARDSPAKLTDENGSKFVQIEYLLKLIDQIQCSHIFVVFDACYVGAIWQARFLPVPQVARIPATSNNQTVSLASATPQSKLFQLASWTIDAATPASTIALSIQDKQQNKVYALLPRNEYIKRKMKTRTRIIFTSGDRPVYDGNPGQHSPFARGFLEALDQGGTKYGILTTGEIYLKIDALNVEPGRGSLSGSDGDFVFVAPEKPKN